MQRANILVTEASVHFALVSVGYWSDLFWV
jgi:hypothetical protein